MRTRPAESRAWRCAFALALTTSWALPGTAAVLALTGDVQGRLSVSDAGNGALSVQSLADCCAVQTATVAAQTNQARVWFVENQGDTQSLRALSYGAAAASIGPNPIDPGHRITHLHFDTSKQRLVGLAWQTSVATPETLQEVTLSNTGAITVLSSASGPSAPLSLQAGVSTYAASNNSLYVLGSVSGTGGGPTIQALLRFDFDTPSSTPAQSWPISGGDWLNTENVVALARNPADAKVYGLSWLPFAGSTRLVRFDFSGGSVTLTPIGSGVVNGLAVLAGPAAIDPIANALVAVGRNPDGSDASHVVSFNLTSGNVTAGAPLQAAGLWYDAGAGLDRIFANGFEQ